MPEPAGKPGSPVVTGFDWMLSCTADFDATVRFVQDILGLPIARRGTAQTDMQFARYACAPLPGGGTLEIVEPADCAQAVRGRQILCLTVGDIAAAVRELERRGAVFASELIEDGEGLGWIYVQAPGGNMYQVYGPLVAEGGGS